MTTVPPMNFAGLPQGQLVGNYSTMADAENAAARVVEGEVPHEAVTIVGRDVRVVNRLRPRTSYGRVVWRSAIQGAMFGLLLGFLFYSMAGDAAAPGQLGAIVMTGVGVWVLFGVIGQSMRRKRTRFEMFTNVTATSFDVVVAFEYAGKARQILGPQPMPNLAAPTAPTVPSSPSSPTPPTPAAPSAPTPSFGTDRTDQPASDSGQDATSDTSESTQQQPRRSGFEDLPDGRPQFGVRVDDAGNAPAQNSDDDSSGK